VEVCTSGFSLRDGSLLLYPRKEQMMQTHVLGFPRIGVQRELKKALESYWTGATSLQDLDATCDQLKRRHWQIQKDAGLSCVTTGDFSLYDQMLDVSFMLGAIPERFLENVPEGPRALYFQMARGDVRRNRAAMAMTKWFNTNYHYIVPEFTPSLKLSLSSQTIVEDTRLAAALGYAPKPTLIGPITYLSLAKDLEGANRWDRLEEVTALYAEVLAELGALCDWIQMEEPILCADLSAEARRGFQATYETLNRAAGKARILLATYFERLDENLDLAINSGCAGLHLDLVRGKASLNSVPDRLPDGMTLSPSGGRTQHLENRLEPGARNPAPPGRTPRSGPPDDRVELLAPPLARGPGVRDPARPRGQAMDGVFRPEMPRGGPAGRSAERSGPPGGTPD
jgi:5-methyltetrahydropteroyltriglutamate--homocysteine methyltransferase